MDNLKLEEFRKRVIEKIHDEEHGIDIMPITIGRVIHAIGNFCYFPSYSIKVKENTAHIGYLNSGGLFEVIAIWKLTKADGFTEATGEDQTEETISKLLEIL